MIRRTVRRTAVGLGVAGIVATSLTIVAPAEAGDMLETSGRVGVARVASYNVRGAHLTGGPGGLGPGATRMRRSLDYIERKSISIVALQEFENPAAKVIRRDSDWALYRADDNLHGQDGGNAVMWNKNVWRKISAWQLHVRDPHKRTLHMPIVLLQNRTNRQRVVVMSVHHPAGSENRGWRQRVRQAERERAASLKKNFRHVLVMGDMNENEPVACSFTAGGLMKAATGYRHRANGSCPKSRYSGIDWIFGAGRVTFRNWTVDRRPENQHWSDHPLVRADMTYR